jgi:hypothetical protein
MHSTIHERVGCVPALLKVSRSTSASAPEGRACATARIAPGNFAKGMTMPPSNSNTRYSPFWAARLISPGKGHGADDHADDRQQPARRIRVPAQREGHRDQHGELHDLDGDHRADLGCDQSWSPQWCCAESFEDVIAAFEAGADPEADHRRAHRRQGKDARRQKVDRIVRVGRQHVDKAEEHEQHHRYAQRQQQLLTVGTNTA